MQRKNLSKKTSPLNKSIENLQRKHLEKKTSSKLSSKKNLALKKSSGSIQVKPLDIFSTSCFFRQKFSLNVFARCYFRYIFSLDFFNAIYFFHQRFSINFLARCFHYRFSSLHNSMLKIYNLPYFIFKYYFLPLVKFCSIYCTHLLLPWNKLQELFNNLIIFKI